MENYVYKDLEEFFLQRFPDYDAKFFSEQLAIFLYGRHYKLEKRESKV